MYLHLNLVSLFLMYTSSTGQSAPPSYLGSPFIHSCKFQRSYDIVVVIYNMGCADRVCVMADKTNKQKKNIYI